MIASMCLLFPPFILMLFRKKILSDTISGSLHDNWIGYIEEYAVYACFVNLVSIACSCLIFKHTESFESALRDDTNFLFHYLVLSIVVAIAEPVIEYLLRYHVELKVQAIKSIKMVDIGIYFYALLMVLLNFIRIFDNTFNGDEGFTIRLTKKTFSIMLKATAEDVHPPLHYLLTQFLYGLFGNNGVTYHLTGFIPYAIIIIICCTVIKKQFGRIPAIIVLTMSSILKSAVRYNVEARMYSLASMFVLIAYIAFWNILNNKRVTYWIVFVIASLGAAYTHYYALISVAFFYAMIIPLAINKKEYRKGLIISYIVTIIGYLPWLPILYDSYSDTADHWWLESIPGLRTCVLFLLDYNWLVIVTGIIILVFFLYRFEIVQINYSKEKRIFDRFDMKIAFPGTCDFSAEMYWIITGIISIAGTFMVGEGLSILIRPFFVPRYIFPLSATFYLIIGFCVSKMKWPSIWGIILTIALLGGCIPAYIHTVKTESSWNRQTATVLAKIHPEEEAELLSNNRHLPWTIFEYYYPENKNRKYANQISESTLDGSFDTVWLFWTKELDESSINQIQMQQYEYEKVHEGYFANAKYYIYKLSRS